MTMGYEIATGGKAALAMTVSVRVIARSEAAFLPCVIARRAQPDAAI